jgi:hypothetical protein
LVLGQLVLLLLRGLPLLALVAVEMLVVLQVVVMHLLLLAFTLLQVLV